MTPTLAAVLTIALAVLGIVGIIVPVLPGSITVLLGAVVWGVFGDSRTAVAAAIVAGVLLLVGMSASAVLTKRRLDARQIPQWPVVVALLGGVVGSFLLPGFGLLIGFVVVLLVCELVRVKNLRLALQTSWVALKGVGLGMLIELGLAMTAVMVLGISVFVTLT